MNTLQHPSYDMLILVNTGTFAPGQDVTAEILSEIKGDWLEYGNSPQVALTADRETWTIAFARPTATGFHIHSTLTIPRTGKHGRTRRLRRPAQVSDALSQLDA